MNEIVTLSREPASSETGASTPDARVENLLRIVGQRVRRARKEIGLTGKQLASLSGVSQRYISQLETGHGNISIALLMRIADVLKLDLATLVASHDPWQSDHGIATRLIQTASSDQIARVLSILEPNQPRFSRANRIALIGLRGSGKSTLGKRVAGQLDVPFIELNHEIERMSGIPVHEVIELCGQDGYRALELQALEQISSAESTVILAVAGGIVSQAQSFTYLRQNYHTVWLKTEPDDLMARVRAQGDERPMAGSADAMAELRKILKSREPLYARATATIDTANQTVEDSASTLVATILENGFLTDR